MRQSLLLLSSSLCLTVPALAQRGANLMGPVERTVAMAADADNTGVVAASEWTAFLDGLKVLEDGSYDRYHVMAACARRSVDENGDGILKGEDADARLRSLDADGSGTLEPSEMLATGVRGGAIISRIVAYGVDTDRSRSVSEEEWRVAIEPVGEEVPDERLAAWMLGAEQSGTSEGSAFGPATVLLTLSANLDVDKDGSVRRDDLQSMFTTLDTNGDGGLATAELARGGRTGGFEVDERDIEVGDMPRMPFQRNLDDALAISRETGKPLLICVNMDAESASESLAARRYRSPKWTEAVAGFVPLLVSPDRHGVLDYDDDGRRIVDEKFGRVLSPEHMDYEPVLFERYFRGQRVAPRHVGVSPEGDILFDIYLINDFSIIDRALEEHGVGEPLPDPATLDEAALFASHDAGARDRLEAIFHSADDETRLRFAKQAFAPDRSAQHPEILRMALRDRAAAVRQAAVDAIAAHPELVPPTLAPEALRALSDRPEASIALGAALRAHAETLPGILRQRARRLGRIAEARLLTSPVIDVDLWKAALAGATPAPTPDDLEPLFVAADALSTRLEEAPEDAQLNLMLSRTLLRLASGQIAKGTGNPGFLFEDARIAAQAAVDADPDLGLAWACLAQSCYMTSDFEAAGVAAERALPLIVPHAGTRLAADVLRAFALTRLQTLYSALGSENGWPPEWIADVLSAYEVLFEHPYGTEALARAALDVMTNLELHAEQGEFLVRAIARYPESGDLHNYYRWQVLRDEGARGLLEAYRRIDAPLDAFPTLLWYQGLADFIAAERLVRDGFHERALAAYAKCIEDFEASIEEDPSFDASARYYTCLAWSGAARVHAQLGQLEEAANAIEASAAANPEGFENTDGVGNTPISNARFVIDALEKAGNAERAVAVRAALPQSGS